MAGGHPAEECPREPGAPAREDVTRVVNAEIDAAEADEEAQQEGEGDEVDLERAGLDQTGQGRAKRPFRASFSRMPPAFAASRSPSAWYWRRAASAPATANRKIRSTG